MIILQVIENEDPESEDGKIPDQKQRKRTASISFHSSNANNENENNKIEEVGVLEQKKIKFQQSLTTKGKKKKLKFKLIFFVDNAIVII